MPPVRPRPGSPQAERCRRRAPAPPSTRRPRTRRRRGFRCRCSPQGVPARSRCRRGCRCCCSRCRQSPGRPACPRAASPQSPPATASPHESRRSSQVPCDSTAASSAIPDAPRWAPTVVRAVAPHRIGGPGSTPQIYAELGRPAPPRRSRGRPARVATVVKPRSQAERRSAMRPPNGEMRCGRRPQNDPTRGGNTQVPSDSQPVGLGTAARPAPHHGIATRFHTPRGAWMPLGPTGSIVYAHTSPFSQRPKR